MKNPTWQRSNRATHVTSSVITSYAVALMPAIIFIFISISVALSGREVSLYGIVAGKLTESSLIEIAVLQLGTFLLIGLSLLVVFNVLANKLNSNSASRLMIFSGFMVFWITQKITAGFSLGNDFKYQDLYVLIIIYGTIWFKLGRSERPFEIIKYSLLAINIIGFIFLFIAPNIVRQNEYANAIYFEYRYWGLASHANNLGPQLVLLGLLAIFFPCKSRALQRVAYAVVLVGLVLSQSKTAIISCAVAFFLYRYVFAEKKSTGKAGERKFKLATMLAAISVVNIGLIIFFGDNIVANQLITGRGQIWAISMIEFFSNPWFGGGGRVWSDDFAERFGYLGIASNAHNQIVDILSFSGIVGCLALLIFLICLIYMINLENKSGRAFAFLILFLMVRGFSEVPFRLGVPMSNDFAILIVLVMFAVASRVRPQLPNSMLAQHR